MKTCNTKCINSIINVIRTHLHNYSEAGYMYGSFLTDPNSDRDIDILVIANPNRIQLIWSRILMLMEAIGCLIHPVIISHKEFKSNYLFGKIAKSGIVMWEK